MNEKTADEGKTADERKTADETVERRMTMSSLHDRSCSLT
jgi:hypothetical protein